MKRNLKQLIAKGTIDKAISLLSQYYDENGKEIPENLILLSARFHNNEALDGENVIDRQDYNIEKNKITKSFLKLIDELIDDTDQELAIEENKPKGTSKTLLFIASNPKGIKNMDLPREYLSIRKILRPYGDKYHITEEFDASLDAFMASIEREEPDILHFSGFSDDEGIYLENTEENGGESIPQKYLASTLRLANENLQCLFLNLPYSREFAKAVAKHIPYVIGTNGVCSARAAISFSSGFYSSLALHKNDFEKAFNTGIQLLDEAKNHPTNHDSELAHASAYSINPDIAVINGENPEEIKPYVLFIKN